MFVKIVIIMVFTIALTTAIDQVVRTLTGDKYEEFVKFYEHDDVLGEEYDWDTGIAP